MCIQSCTSDESVNDDISSMEVEDDDQDLEELEEELRAKETTLANLYKLRFQMLKASLPILLRSTAQQSDSEQQALVHRQNKLRVFGLFLELARLVQSNLKYDADEARNFRHRSNSL